MIRSKGIFDLAAGIANVQGFTLDLYGPIVRPSEFKEWKNFVHQLGAEARVSYRGAVSPEDMRQRLLEYDALISASHSESFGLVAAEAMESGMPVIATRTGFLEQAPTDAFISIPANDVSGISNVLSRIRDHPAALLTAALHGDAFADGYLSERVVMPQWVSLYKEIHEPRH